MDTLYSRLADDIAHQVAQGVYGPGDKLPGIRAASHQQGVSRATVVAAYEQLEARGYVEARPRSGFYVSDRWRCEVAEPAESRPAMPPQAVSGQSLVMQLIQSARQPGVIQLGAAVIDAQLLPQRAVEQAIAAAARGQQLRHLGYELPGLPGLRKALAQRLAQLRCPVSPDDIVMTGGCQEAIYLTLKHLTRPGDVVALESPTFYGILQVVEALGLKALEIPTHPREGISLPALRLAMEQWPIKACVLVPNFSNPLGSCMNNAQKQALVELANQQDVILIEDDIYGDMGFDHRRPSPLKRFDTQDRVVYCSSASKALSPGLRIGWAVSGRLATDIAYQKYVTNGAAPAVSQLVLEQLLTGSRLERHLRGLRSELARSAQSLTAAVSRYFPAETRVTQPRGGAVLWVELPEHVDAVQLSREALADNISLAPGTIFSVTDKYNHCLRLSFGMRWTDRLEWAVMRLGELINRQRS